MSKFYEATPFGWRPDPYEVVPPSAHHVASKESYANMGVQYLRVERLRCKADGDTHYRFTAGSLSNLMAIAGFPAPLDPRWMGTVMQRAKREGLIEQATAKGVPLTASTPAGHKTPVWKYRW